MNTKAIILVERLAMKAKREHYACDEDPWYNCPADPNCVNDDEPKGVCTCGADQHNAAVLELRDLLIKELS